MHRDIVRRIDSDPHLIAVDSDHRHGDIVANP
jgi:hypothetical protein